MIFLHQLDHFLNQRTMYRLVCDGLLVLVGLSLLLAVGGYLPFSVGSMLLLLLLVGGTSYLVQWFFRWLLHPAANFESTLITALIFFLVLAPPVDGRDVWVTVATVAIGIASKYLLAVDKKHLFNPVAIALVVMGLLGFGNAIWWVASAVLLPVVALLALAIVRKLRRFDLFVSFVLASLLTLAWWYRSSGTTVLVAWQQMFLSWPLLFLGGVMLTEPLTGPVRRQTYILYGAVVGVLFASRFQWGPLHATPELALVLGNLLAYFLTKQVKLELRLQHRRQLGPDLYEFDFKPRGQFNFLPGQYLEWTLSTQQVDSRGNRRYFTIASSPTEPVLRIAVKIAHPASSFKQQLLAMQKGELIVASQLAGDFVLPRQRQLPLCLVAGGIGITPFRSMGQYLLDRREQRDVILFYICSHPADFLYRPLWAKLAQYGWRVVYVLSDKQQAPADWSGEQGYLSQAMVKKWVGDYQQRHFYLSGPNVMVESYQQLLRDLGVQRRQIKTDYFPGF